MYECALAKKHPKLRLHSAGSCKFRNASWPLLAQRARGGSFAPAAAPPPLCAPQLYSGLTPKEYESVAGLSWPCASSSGGMYLQGQDST